MRKKLKYDTYESQGKSRHQFKPPVYEYPPKKYSAEKILNILLTAKPEQICQHKPKMITRSATFVVDVRCLENQEDIKKMNLGFGTIQDLTHRYFM